MNVKVDKSTARWYVYCQFLFIFVIDGLLSISQSFSPPVYLSSCLSVPLGCRDMYHCVQGSAIIGSYSKWAVPLTTPNARTRSVTGQKNNLDVTRARTRTGVRSLGVLRPELWNELPTCITVAHSSPKYRLNKYLLSTDWVCSLVLCNLLLSVDSAYSLVLYCVSMRCIHHFVTAVSGNKLINKWK